MQLVSEENGRFAVSRRAWFDPEVMREEIRRIFSRSWLFLGHESEIPEPGDYVTRRLGVDPVILSRAEDGSVNVVANACSHRGVKLCRSDRGNTSHFRCPYHGWTFTSEGDLTGVTSVAEVFGRDFDKSRLPLNKPAQVTSIFGLVFATWSAEVPSLEEYLGDALWYLESAFGGFDNGVEVLGAPARTISATNWKPETENLSGDGYHTPITHQSAFVLGMFAAPDELEQMASKVKDSYTGRVIDAGNGHTFRVQHLPIDPDEPSFFGFPEDLWPQMKGRLDEGQANLQSRISVFHGNVFPNLTFLENFKASTDGKGGNCRYIRLSTQVPISPDRAEMLWWCFVPKDSEPAWRLQSERAYLRTSGPAGMFQIDDNENFAGFADAHSGEVMLDEKIEFQGVGTSKVNTELGWPGIVYDNNKSEETLRAFWRRWGKDMEGARSNGSRPAAAPTAGAVA